MTESQNSNTKPGVLRHVWRAMGKFLRSRLFGEFVTDKSLRFTSDGNVELDMEHFLARKDVKKRIREIEEFAAALDLAQKKHDRELEKFMKLAVALNSSPRSAQKKSIKEEIEKLIVLLDTPQHGAQK